LNYRQVKYYSLLQNGFVLLVHAVFWLVDFQDNHLNYCHQLVRFQGLNAPSSILAGALPQTLLRELTTPPLKWPESLAGFNGTYF